jgi:hypothetical protein
VGVYKTDDLKKMPRRGVIYTVAPSPKDINTIWAGTDDGLIQVTRDGGKTWKNVTPPEITSWSKLSMMDASHFDVNTAYAAVNRIRLDDMHPHIYKTTDGGKTWKEIVGGLPTDPINTVREDPYRKGLLYAGSERAVYVSFDDGENWQSLRLNMPATSIRDLVVKDDDIVVGTHGRGFWILDDVTALRQQQAAITTTLFKPANTYRVRWSMGTDTPLPQEEPAGQNPPDGAIIDYYLDAKSTGPVTLEITSAEGQVVRSYSSNDTLYKIPPVNIPLYWVRPQQILSAEAGSHRFLWDMHYAPLNIPASYPISAVYANTAPQPTSPWAMPGVYHVTLKVNGKTYTESFTLKIDPRVQTTIADLQQQHDLSIICYEGRKKTRAALGEISQARQSIKGLANANDLDAQAAALQNQPRGSKNPSLGHLENTFAALLNILHEADVQPTLQTSTAVKDAQLQLQQLLPVWDALKKKIADLQK